MGSERVLLLAWRFRRFICLLPLVRYSDTTMVRRLPVVSISHSVSGCDE